MGVYRCCCSLMNLKFSGFSTSRTKRVIYAFSINGAPHCFWNSFLTAFPVAIHTTFGVSRCANICILYICCKKRNKKIYFFYTRRIASLHVHPPPPPPPPPPGVCMCTLLESANPVHPTYLLTYLLFSKKG